MIAVHAAATRPFASLNHIHIEYTVNPTYRSTRDTIPHGLDTSHWTCVVLSGTPPVDWYNAQAMTKNMRAAPTWHTSEAALAKSFPRRACQSDDPVSGTGCQSPDMSLPARTAERCFVLSRVEGNPVGRPETARCARVGDARCGRCGAGRRLKVGWTPGDGGASSVPTRIDDEARSMRRPVLCTAVVFRGALRHHPDVALIRNR